MSTPEPELRWYQFSLRSLLLLVLAVALFCSLGVCTNWVVSVLLAAIVLIGGVMGRIVAGRRVGFAVGVLFAIDGFCLAFVAYGTLIAFFPQLLEATWQLWVTASGLAVLLGGILGGLS